MVVALEDEVVDEIFGEVGKGVEKCGVGAEVVKFGGEGVVEDGWVDEGIRVWVACEGEAVEFGVVTFGV